MVYSQKFSDLLRAAIGERSQQEIARDAGLHESILSRAVRWGKAPTRTAVTRLADALGLTGESRAEFFAAAGYIEVPDDAAEAVTA